MTIQKARCSRELANLICKSTCCGRERGVLWSSNSRELRLARVSSQLFVSVVLNLQPGFGLWWMELAWMGPAPSYRLLYSLFLPPLPSPSAIRLTARRASKCASTRGASGVVEQCRRSWSRGYLLSPVRIGTLTVRSDSRVYGGFGRGVVKETDRSGFVVVRNSRSRHGVVGSSWTKAGGDSTSAKSVDSEQSRTVRRSPPSEGAGRRPILMDFT